MYAAAAGNGHGPYESPNGCTTFETRYYKIALEALAGEIDCRLKSTQTSATAALFAFTIAVRTSSVLPQERQSFSIWEQTVRELLFM